MADIKLTGSDFNNSSRSGGSQLLVFALSGRPRDDWRANFNSLVKENPVLKTYGVNFNDNPVSVSVQGSANHTPKEIQDALNAVINQANNAEDEFQKQLQELKF